MSIVIQIFVIQTSSGVAEARTLSLDLRALKSQNPIFFLRIHFYTV